MTATDWANIGRCAHKRYFLNKNESEWQTLIMAMNIKIR